MKIRLWGSFVGRCIQRHYYHGGQRKPLSSYSYIRPFSTHDITRETAPVKEEDSRKKGEKGRWVTLPPFDRPTTGTTVMKWVRRCCPSVPSSLIHKLFRLRKFFVDSWNRWLEPLTKSKHRRDNGTNDDHIRTIESSVKRDLDDQKHEQDNQVHEDHQSRYRRVPSSPSSCYNARFISMPFVPFLKYLKPPMQQVKKQLTSSKSDCSSSQDQERSFKRVAANDEINYGDIISLPITINAHPSLPNKTGYCCSKDEIDYIQSLELYKDSTIIALNKPHGLAVQGGIDIKISMDALAATCLRYEYEEPPLLVHRLDKDSSGILVLARNQISAAILHSVFREKTFEASRDNDGDKKFLHRKYWALVIGRPRNSRGRISEPLKKVVLGNGTHERVVVSNQSSQVAITEYKVIGSHQNGCTWLELCPRTGRKHQLRVHCAEVLGTPILGDFKYGWQANKRWASVPSLSSFDDRNSPSVKLPFGLDSDGGSILDEVPRLHLHCREMKLPDISLIIQQLHSSSDQKQDLSKIKYLDLVAPLPCHMQKSWDIFNELSTSVHFH